MSKEFIDYNDNDLDIATKAYVNKYYSLNSHIHKTDTLIQDTNHRFMTDLEKSKIAGIESGAQVNTITGIKGGSESTYRTGNVNITASNIGLDKVENKSSSDILASITSSTITSALGYTPVNSNKLGAPSGVAQLDSNGLILTSQLPSFVDDVLEADTKDELPETGETGKIYVALDSNLTYRWSGTAYVEISQSIALGETSSTAYRGDLGAIAYDHSNITGNPHGLTKADLGLGNVNNTADSTKTVAAAGKLTNTKAIGSSTQPVYFSTSGVPVATTYKLEANVPSTAVFTDTTYSIATTSANGLMSSIDKSKLNGIDTNANKTTIVDNVSSTSATSALSANQGKLLADRIAALEEKIKTSIFFTTEE